jgi:hypothetical protein
MFVVVSAGYETKFVCVCVEVNYGDASLSTVRE